MLRIGIMGGTFDPIHSAHLMTAEAARTRFELDQVLFIPAGQPPHKFDYRVTEAEHRYAMVILGTAANPAFEVSRMEIERVGPSYSVDTLCELKELYGRGTEIYFIIGADEALDLLKWHESERLPELARFVAAPRPGFDLPELENLLPRNFLDAIDMLPMMPIDISATEIRERVASEKSIRYLVPDNVEAYIHKHGLYREGITK